MKSDFTVIKWGIISIIIGTNPAFASDYTQTLGNASIYSLSLTDSASNDTISIPSYVNGVLQQDYYTLNIKQTILGQDGWDSSKKYSIEISPDYSIDFTAKYNTSNLSQHITATKTAQDVTDKHFIDLSDSITSGKNPNKEVLYDFGGAITNFQKKLGNISGIFIGNNATTTDEHRQAWGGAVLARGTTGNIIADFIANYADSGDSEASGGALATVQNEIAQIKGNYIGNYTYSRKNAGAYGGAIYTVNKSIIKNLDGSFVGNYALSAEGVASGGAIDVNWNGRIENIRADFIGNYTNGITTSHGGAISVSGRLDNITGDFIKNYVISNNDKGSGGAISISNDARTTIEKGIGNITGNFIENYVKALNSATGGALSTEFVMNKINSNFYNNFALSSEQNAFGGAIYMNAELNDSIEGDFIGNHAISNKGEAKGGAIYTNKNLKFVANNKDMIFAGNYTLSNGKKDDNAIYVSDSNINLDFMLKNKNKLILADNIDGIKGYNINIVGNNMNELHIFNDLRNADVSFQNLKINTVNANAHIYKVNSLNLSSSVDFVSDVDFHKEIMDSFRSENGYTIKEGSKINVLNLNWINEPKKDKTSILFAEKGLKDSVVYKGEEKIVTPVYIYNIAYKNMEDGGYFEFSRGTISNELSKYNPAVIGSGVTSSVGATSIVKQTFNYAFQNSDNFMNLPSGERAFVDDRFMTTYRDLASPMNDKRASMWVKPYLINEDVILKNGAVISNKTYGTLVGYDTGIDTINNDWSGAFTYYVGYSGASQKYEDVDSHLKGGLAGATFSLYKGDFFNATTISAGVMETESKSIYGKDDYTTTLGGIGNKIGYNIELRCGKFIIQPTLFMAYSYIDTEDYKNTLGVKIENKAMHSFQISPGIKFIANLANNWKPYIEVNKIWNINEDAKTTADGARLPSMYVKPYITYGVGIQGTIGNNLMFYGQSMIEEKGRDGISVTGGLRWMF